MGHELMHLFLSTLALGVWWGRHVEYRQGHRMSRELRWCSVPPTNSKLISCRMFFLDSSRYIVWTRSLSTKENLVAGSLNTCIVFPLKSRFLCVECNSLLYQKEESDFRCIFGIEEMIAVPNAYRTSHKAADPTQGTNRYVEIFWSKAIRCDDLYYHYLLYQTFFIKSWRSRYVTEGSLKRADHLTVCIILHELLPP